MNNFSVARPESQILETNKVLKNTYILLSTTLIFSAINLGINRANRQGANVALETVSRIELVSHHELAASLPGLNLCCVDVRGQ